VPEHLRRLAIVITGGVLLLGGCSSSDESSANGAASTSGQDSSVDGDTTSTDNEFPDVISVDASADSDGTYTFAVTMSSPYDTPERYADGWRILGPDDEVYAEMTLGHDHATEQPFTRTQTGVEIPDGVESVMVEGRDIENGYGGARVTVDLP
jgi:hypothetical protein